PASAASTAAVAVSGLPAAGVAAFFAAVDRVSFPSARAVAAGAVVAVAGAPRWLFAGQVSGFVGPAFAPASVAPGPVAFSAFPAAAAGAPASVGSQSDANWAAGR